MNRKNIHVCHWTYRRWIFNEHSSLKGTVMSAQNRNPVLLCKLCKILWNNIIMGNDKGTNLWFYAEALNVLPVTAYNYNVFALMFFQNCPCWFKFIVGYHDGTLEVVVFIKGNNRSCIQCLFNKVNACKENLISLGIENFEWIEGKSIVIQEPLICSVCIDDWKNRSICTDHSVNGFPEGNIVVNSNKFVRHVVFSFWNQVRNIFGRLNFKSFKNIFCLRCKFSSTGCNIFIHA